MSDYKEYRPKKRLFARLIDREVTVLVRAADGDGLEEKRLETGSHYEVISDPGGMIQYMEKSTFDAANEPVRRERQPKQANTKPAKKRTVTATLTQPTSSS